MQFTFDSDEPLEQVVAKIEDVYGVSLRVEQPQGGGRPEDAGQPLEGGRSRHDRI